MSKLNHTEFELPLTTHSQQNGRVNLEGKETLNFPGYTHEKKAEAGFEADMLRGNWETTSVSQAFFSPSNVGTIQNAIRRYVYEKSQPKGYVIDDQSADELKIIMRAIYYQYAKNLPFNVSQQVSELNEMVVNWSGPHILSAVDHYHYYLKDISHLPVPMAQPKNLSRAGSKSLPFNQFV